MKYRRKPIIVEAYQYLGESDPAIPGIYSIMGIKAYIDTIMGSTYRLEKGEYVVIRNNKISVFKKDFFDENYEMVEQ